MHDLLRALVPRAWTGEQALVVARLCRAFIDALWDVHGASMAEAMDALPVEHWGDFLAEGLGDEEDDEIPF